MILKQKAFQKLAQIMKLKENQEKKATSRYRTRIWQKLGVHGAEQFNADTTRPNCRRYQKCYNLYSPFMSYRTWFSQVFSYSIEPRKKNMR